MAQRDDIIPMEGGLDIVTPAVAKAPGTLIASQNFESSDRGYRRCDGYERFDGRAKPSDAATYELAFLNGTTEPSVDDLVEGATSGAYGWLVEVDVTSGTWGGGDAAGTMILRHITGDFSDGESLQVSASTFAAADGVANPAWASSDTELETYRVAAATAARALIDEVPGSGPVRGVWTLNGEYFAVRDNAGATAAVIHKAGSSGWQAVSLGHTLDFDTGNASSGTVGFNPGDTVTGGTSGATATIERVSLMGGAWDGTGEGYFVLSGITGTFQASEVLTGPTGTAAAVDAQAAITLNPGGKYRTIRKNFYGATASTRIYGASGENRGFEFDGSVYVPIRTGLSDALDKPSYVGEFSKHLFLGVGSSLMISSIGVPIQYNVNTGAGEIAVGHDLTGLESGYLGALIVFSKDRVSYVTGSDVTDFSLDDISPDSGAFADTSAVVGMPYFLDNEGIRSLEASEAYGDWKMGTETAKVKPWLRGKINGGTDIVGALRVRAKDTYRIYFGDGTGLAIYFGRKDPEPMPFTVGFTPYVLASGKDSSDRDVIFAGGTDGFVYQLDIGTSFDGDAVVAFFLLAHVFQKAPNLEKRYHRMKPEISEAQDGVEIDVVGHFAFGDSWYLGMDNTMETVGRGGFWDVSLWDDFYWDAPIVSDDPVDINGIGRSIALGFTCEEADTTPFTISSLTLFWSPRKVKR